jgi:hypothetical protein
MLPANSFIGIFLGRPKTPPAPPLMNARSKGFETSAR